MCYRIALEKSLFRATPVKVKGDLSGSDDKSGTAYEIESLDSFRNIKQTVERANAEGVLRQPSYYLSRVAQSPA